MVVGICTLELFIPDSGSLKGKRYILKSLISRVKNRFNISIAEVDHNDLWQRATLGMATVTNGNRHANEMLSKVVNFIEMDRRVHIIDYSIEIRQG